MHGIIFAELQKFAEQKLGFGSWKTLLTKAGLQTKMYLPAGEYPDTEIGALVTAAATLSGQTPTQVLEAFGEFIVPSLLKMYGHLLKPEWKTLEVIEHTEGTIHTVVRVSDSAAKPPKLRTRRENPNTVVLIYSSPRQMCALAMGIGKGIARHFKEKISIEQTQCMHQGAPNCEIIYKKTG